MSLTLLLDLDDTLLDTNVPAFVPAYFQALASQPFRNVAVEKFAPALSEGTRLMHESADPSRTMQDVFESYFYPTLKITKESIFDRVERFYDEVFPTLGSLTSSRPEATYFVSWAISKGFRIVIATDPIFPRKATYQRLRWAGFDPKQFELVSTFENFHFSKTYSAYYAEILAQLGWPQGPILMVGNDAERDIAPAKSLGLATYHLIRDTAQRSATEANGQGTFADLKKWLEVVDVKSLEPQIESMESYISILMATPAALSSFMKNASFLTLRPAPNEWAFVEILCHFRDTEKEIHLDHIARALREVDPFLSSPNTHDWAERRGYLKQDPDSALRDFTNTRLELLSIIKALTPEDLERRSRHSIFGPTTMRELVAFMVEHDRLHLNQVWKYINSERQTNGQKI